MRKITKEDKEKIKTGLELLCEENTTFDKITKMTGLLKGINPKVDKHLISILAVASEIKKVQSGDVLTLSAESIPDNSEEAKKRKKLLLLLTSSWKNLQGEIIRVKDLRDVASSTGLTSKETLVKSGKIMATAKGPLGVVTIIAAGIVAVTSLLESKSVEVSIKNVGCAPISPVLEQKIDFPGLKLPSSPIVSGSTDTAKLPALNLTVDATSPGTISLSALNLSREYSIPYGIKDIIYDGSSLTGKITEVRLSDSKTHELIIKCTK